MKENYVCLVEAHRQGCVATGDHLKVESLQIQLHLQPVGKAGQFANLAQQGGILSLRRLEEYHPPVPIEEIEASIEARRAARLGRNFAEADRIRAELDGRGIILEDTGTVTRWKRK